MSKVKKVIAIFGFPRSGTSFLGQIFDSCPSIAYRLEPIFSYKLKNMVSENSTKEEFIDFFEKAFDSVDDEFMNQVEKREKGLYPIFQKTEGDVLVIKTTRFHHILPTLLKLFDKDFLKIVSLARHPAGVIYSWINHPNEFPSGYDYHDEWRTGSCRKNAIEEFWGFDDWKSVMTRHIELEEKYDNFKIFQYENLIKNIEDETAKLFDYTGVSYTEQTAKFLRESQGKHIDNPYAVYKDKSVTSKWVNNLDYYIQEEIINECSGTALLKFLAS